jgi:hypothetical protein
MRYLLAFNVSLPFAWLTRSMRQPRYNTGLADIMGMYQARFLADPLFDIASSDCSKEKMEDFHCRSMNTTSAVILVGTAEPIWLLMSQKLKRVNVFP